MQAPFGSVAKIPTGALPTSVPVKSAWRRSSRSSTFRALRSKATPMKPEWLPSLARRAVTVSETGTRPPSFRM